MEEYIKILKKIKKETLNAAANAYTSSMSDIWRKEAQAIEKVLYQLGQDERVINAMAEMLFAYRYNFLPLEDCTSEKQIIDYFRKKVG